MHPSHAPWLVALSLLVALQGSFVGLHLARQISQAQGPRYHGLIAASSLSLALAIWTMHFVGMLAVQIPFAADFLVLPTLLSFLVCVLVVGVGVFIVSRGRPSGGRIALAACFMGAGIVVMHYIGMMALHGGLHMEHDPAFVVASVVIGIAASGLALWFGFAGTAPRSIGLSAVIMALAMSAMHYTAMSGTLLFPHALMSAGDAPALSPGNLAVVVSVVAFAVSGLFLLILVPAPVPPAVAQTVPVVVAAPVGVPVEALPAVAVAEVTAASDHAKALPIEKNGIRRTLEVSRLVAVQAQAHYTQLFDGEVTWFCPLAITEVEARLDPSIFGRIHRSHIVNLDRITSLRRIGDAGEVVLTTPVLYRAPVARSRHGWLKQQMEVRPGVPG